MQAKIDRQPRGWGDWQVDQFLHPVMLGEQIPGNGFRLEARCAPETASGNYFSFCENFLLCLIFFHVNFPFKLDTFLIHSVPGGKVSILFFSLAA